ncbi:putative alpha-1,2-mannosidase subfamily [Venustampulla echinocandica]|uniref:Putative alpha-1,2-mannosidase subfamily n=1 Tax=Venustampulla echinocandica TaxID=2656787 RepID=A0A370TAX5_9HELO|nr:putative alpha-1,2-mannosidase subfamily [Venustampulla echinocandica]RDL31079.1 putative alpha-1,2-mannosidase subfamily [Venustampulla echinocandica]
MYNLKQKSLLGLLLVPLAVAAVEEARDTSFDKFVYIDPLIGTINGGHVFPGATLPFGMAKAVADTNNPNENQGGFASDDSEITGFSHMHDSGTGGAPSLGNFPIFPQTGCRDDNITNCFFSEADRAVKRKKDTTFAKPGYFAVTLETGIRTQITVSNHSVLYSIEFPYKANTTELKNQTGLPYSPLILVDLTDLPDSIRDGGVQVDPKTGRQTGHGTFSPSFGMGSYQLYFCIDFKGAEVRDTGVWQYGKPLPKPANGTTPKLEDWRFPAGGWTQFHPPAENNQILARVGVSFISIDKACKNAETEIPDFDFAKVQTAATNAWRDKLSVVEIEEGQIGTRFWTVFWSGIYRSMISPQDYTGENPLWNSTEPYYDSYYCIWDSFRSIHPLLTILDPESQTLMVRSLIDIYRHEGKLPDCRMSLCQGWTQGGSNADVVLADAYLKNIKDGVDWETGYKAVVSDAEEDPPNWSVAGRGGLEDWKTKGFIPKNENYDTRSVSRTVEYAYNDFCIAEMSKRLGHPDDAEKYYKRSQNWMNLYKADQTSIVPNSNGHEGTSVDPGFIGFLQPKHANGSWAYQDPFRCSPLLGFTSCYLNGDGGETYEGSAWMYTFYVPQDMATLIKTLGGPESFVDRLSYLHTSGLLYIGDEQAFLPVFQFHYAGRPGLSSYFSHFYIPSQFNESLNGIPGNDDSGAMGSFSTLAMIGLYPVAGQNVYLINAPYLPSVSITNRQTGKKATIKSINFDPGFKNIYIQSAKLNGEEYTKNWIGHEFWLDGGVLELTLGSTESKWGTKPEDLPPSLSTGQGS